MVRVKHRYLVVNFLYPEPNSKTTTPLPDLVQIHSPAPDSLYPGLILRMIRDQVSELYGDYGMGMISSSLKINYYSPSTSTAIIRCPRDHYQMVWAALTYITHLPTKVPIPVVIRVIRLSGTIKKAEEEVIRRSQQIIKRAKAWEDARQLPMIQGVERAVERERRSEREVLAEIDEGEGSDGMSE